MALGIFQPLLAQAPVSPPPPGEERRQYLRERLKQRAGGEEGGEGGPTMEKLLAVLKMRAPNEDTLRLRDRLNALAQLSDAELQKELEQWTPYRQMGIGEKGQLLTRIQHMREVRVQLAQRKAAQLGLKLSDEQFKEFTEAFWQAKLEMERKLWEEMEPRRNQLQQELEATLKARFGSAAVPAPSPAPPAP
jgi:hypothetical protein